MEHKNTILTILLVLLISLAVFAVVKFKKGTPSDDKSSLVYEEKDNKIQTPNSNIKKEEKDECIASFTTTLTYPDDKRTHNITTCCNWLNDTVIKKGEVFSFNDTLGPFSAEQGYTDSTGFDGDGKIIKIIGGGICQVSSTLYNTALNSKLEIIERNEHSAPVDYVPQGKDATICYPYVDLKFKNTSDSDITVKAVCDGKTVTVELWHIV